jgi:hypothetical protein
MVFIAKSALLGLSLGFLSFYHQKWFLAALGTLFGVAKVWFVLIVMVGRPIAAEFSPTGRSEGWFMDMIYLYQALFRSLPESLQLALFLLPIFIIVGRLLTWVHFVLCPKQALPLTDAERHAHTMKNFSFKKR